VLIRHPRRFMTPSFNNRRQARWAAIRLRARPGEDTTSSHGYGLELAFSPGPPGSPGSLSQGRTARTPCTERYFPGRSDSSHDPRKPAPNGGSGAQVAICPSRSAAARKPSRSPGRYCILLGRVFTNPVNCPVPCLAWLARDLSASSAEAGAALPGVSEGAGPCLQACPVG
jgi:hypothetical protein